MGGERGLFTVKPNPFMFNLDHNNSSMNDDVREVLSLRLSAQCQGIYIYIHTYYLYFKRTLVSQLKCPEPVCPASSDKHCFWHPWQVWLSHTAPVQQMWENRWIYIYIFLSLKTICMYHLVTPPNTHQAGANTSPSLRQNRWEETCFSHRHAANQCFQTEQLPGAVSKRQLTYQVYSYSQCSDGICYKANMEFMHLK